MKEFMAQEVLPLEERLCGGWYMSRVDISSELHHSYCFVAGLMVEIPRTIWYHTTTTDIRHCQTITFL
eukprot:scaffold1340_cov233-Amphora_coffeaeformis.AAC.14